MSRGDNHGRNRWSKKSDRYRQQRGRRSPDPQNPEANDQNINDPAGDKLQHSNEKRFSILVDSVPYMIQAVPFSFNGETRYRVRFNGSPEHVFTWDSSLGQLRAINDESSTIPDNLEIAISEKLQSKA
jgi:hypothetical protein